MGFPMTFPNSQQLTERGHPQKAKENRTELSKAEQQGGHPDSPFLLLGLLFVLLLTF